MALKIYFNIEADTVDEFRQAVAQIGIDCSGSLETVSDEELDAVLKDARSKPVSRLPSLDAVTAYDPAPLTQEAPSIVAMPEVKEAQASENARMTNIVSEAIASADTLDLDAHGHPWSADLHASTKGKTQDGLWRMGKGKARPDPMPGYPKTETGYAEPANDPDGNSPSNEVPTAPEAAAVEEDEFAQFRTAAASTDEVASPAAREWSDADIAKAANWAATALGGAEKVVAARDKFIPAGMVPKTMNIPVEDREAFVTELEQAVGQSYPG